MLGDTISFFGAKGIENVLQMHQAITDLRDHYRRQGLPQPPLPDDVLQLVPCSIDVTETEGAHGMRTGKVLITKPDGETLFEQDWLVSAGQS